MVTERKLQSAQIIGIEGQSINICMMVIKMITFNKRNLEKEEWSEKTDEEVPTYYTVK